MVCLLVVLDSKNNDMSQCRVFFDAFKYCQEKAQVSREMYSCFLEKYHIFDISFASTCFTKIELFPPLQITIRSDTHSICPFSYR